MLRWMLMSAGALAAGAAVPAGAQSAVSLPGSFNSEIGCAGDWSPDCTQAQMTLGSDGLWRRTYALPVGTYEYKIAYDNAWDVNYGAGGVLGGASMTLNAPGAGQNVSFIYTPTSHLVDVLFGQPGSVYLPGSFNSEMGCAGDWDPGCAQVAMLLNPDGYWYALLTLPGGAYEYKIAYNGTWDENYGAGGAGGGANISLNLASPLNSVYFRYDPTTHLVLSQLSPFSVGSGGVPEPSTWAMMLFGFGGIGFAVRRRKRTAAAGHRAV